MGGAFLKSNHQGGQHVSAHRLFPKFIADPPRGKSLHLPTVLGQHQPLDTPVKMFQTFHPFSKLPPEIRHKIWEAAVRSFDVPGVHFFSLQMQDKSEWSVEPRTLDDGIPVPALSRVQSAVLASPHVLWWSHCDVSSHLIDGGLWTACRESNTIIGRHYRQCEPKVWVKESSVYGHKQVECILPQLDLICLTSISGLPCLEDGRSPARILGIDIHRTRSRLNIAFDIRRMNIVLRDGKRILPWCHIEQWMKRFIESFWALPPLKMWIIDRKIWMAKASEGGKVFVGHQNLRLVEIFTPTRTAGPNQLMDADVSGALALFKARQFNEAGWRHAVTVGGQSVTVVPAIGVLAVEDRE